LPSTFRAFIGDTMTDVKLWAADEFYEDGTSPTKVAVSTALAAKGHRPETANCSAQEENYLLNQLTSKAHLPPQIDNFRSNGTWTKPAHAKVVQFLLIDRGQDGAGTADTGGGGGGAAGVRLLVTLPAAAVPSPLTVAVRVASGDPPTSVSSAASFALSCDEGVSVVDEYPDASGTAAGPGGYYKSDALAVMLAHGLLPGAAGGAGGAGETYADASDGGAGFRGHYPGGAPGLGATIAPGEWHGGGGHGGKGYGAGGGGAGGVGSEFFVKRGGGGGGGGGGYLIGAGEFADVYGGDGNGTGTGIAGSGAQGVVVITTWFSEEI
jgi:hypothetical protein